METLGNIIIGKNSCWKAVELRSETSLMTKEMKIVWRVIMAIERHRRLPLNRQKAQINKRAMIKTKFLCDIDWFFVCDVSGWFSGPTSEERWKTVKHKWQTNAHRDKLSAFVPCYLEASSLLLRAIYLKFCFPFAIHRACIHIWLFFFHFSYLWRYVTVSCLLLCLFVCYVWWVFYNKWSRKSVWTIEIDFSFFVSRPRLSPFFSFSPSLVHYVNV